MNLILFLITLTISQSIATSYLEYDGWLFVELYHALDINQPEEFTLRGNATISNLNTGSFTIDQEPLTTLDRSKFTKLAESDDFYRLKAIVSHQDGEKKTFLTSSKACALANSQLMDVLLLSLDHTGCVLSVTETVKGGGNCRDPKKINIDSLEEFNTDIFVKHSELAPVPDTASFIQKLEREREARERGDVKDNRGFIAKYWMYIVPVVILMLISGATSPEAGAAAGGR